MKVIVAGLPKTGTKSMHSALEKLGYNVYDYLENTLLLNKEYGKMAKDGWEIEDFRKMYENVDTVMDFPIPMFWEEISKAFPDAKIVLTIRDSEEQWTNSFLDQVKALETNVFFRLMLILSPTFSSSFQDMSRLGKSFFGIDAPTAFSLKKIHYNKSMLRRCYNTHSKYVMQNAPKDKLLVFNCSQGWAPLCEFLGVPTPDEPFPHENKDGEMLTKTKDVPEIRKIKNEMIVTSSLFVASNVAAAIFFRRYGTKILAPLRRLARKFGQ